MTPDQTFNESGRVRKHFVGLAMAVPLLALSGLFTSWGGAVRWKDCWQVAPWECSTQGDEFGVTQPEYVEVFVGSPGAAAPLAIGSLLAFLAVAALVVSTKPRALALCVIVLATPLLAEARDYWQASFDPQDTSTWDVGPLTPAFTPLGYVFIFGGLALVALLVVIDPTKKRRWKPAERSAWVCVAVVGWGHSLWGLYMAPQLLADSHDDPTWMWSLSGVAIVASALLLTWSLGRASTSVPSNTDVSVGRSSP